MCYHYWLLLYTQRWMLHQVICIWYKQLHSGSSYWHGGQRNVLSSYYLLQYGESCNICNFPGTIYFRKISYFILPLGQRPCKLLPSSAVCRNFSRLNFLSDAHYTCVSDNPTIYLRLPPLLNIKNSSIDKYCTIVIQNVLNLEHTRSLTYRLVFPWNISFRWWISNMQIKLIKKP